MMRWKVSFEFFCNRVSKKALFCLLLSLMAYPSLTEAQMKVFPHLQIFLVPSGTQGGTHFIAFWEEHDRLAAGPFPLRLLELAVKSGFPPQAIAGDPALDSIRDHPGYLAILKKTAG